eukprot:UN31294
MLNQKEQEELDEWSMKTSQDWRNNISERAKQRFKHEKGLQQLVYGNGNEEGNSDNDDENSDSDDEFFTIRKPTKKEKKQQKLITNKVLYINLKLKDWSLETNQEEIRDRFVTGNWNKEDGEMENTSDKDEGSDKESGDEENNEGQDFTGTAVKDISVEDDGWRANET